MHNNLVYKPRALSSLTDIFQKQASAESPKLYAAPQSEIYASSLQSLDRDFNWAFVSHEGDYAFAISGKHYVLKAGDENAFVVGEGYPYEQPWGEDSPFVFDKEKEQLSLKDSPEVSFARMTDRDKMTLDKSIMAGEVFLLDPPETRGIFSAFRSEVGKFFIISTNTQSRYPNSMRLLTGFSLDHLTEIPVEGVDAYRDGGTTIFHTLQGKLFVPSKFRRDTQSPAWTPKEGDKSVLQEVSKEEVLELMAAQGIRDNRVFSEEYIPWDEFQPVPLDDIQP